MVNISSWRTDHNVYNNPWAINKLRSAVSRFSLWLKDIYKNFHKINSNDTISLSIYILYYYSQSREIIFSKNIQDPYILCNIA